MTEKPLHVRVAEALGCKLELAPSQRWGQPAGEMEWFCRCPKPKTALTGSVEWKTGQQPKNPRHIGYMTYGEVARYDLSWYATGPYVEKYRLWVQPCEHPHGSFDGPHWTAYVVRGAQSWEGEGKTALIAICHCLIELAAAGKIKQRKQRSKKL